MYLLDTDTLSEFFNGDAQITRRITGVRFSDLWISAVTVEELLEGPLSAIRAINSTVKSKKSATTPADSRRVIAEYARLIRYLEELRKYQILP